LFTAKWYREDTVLETVVSRELFQLGRPAPGEDSSIIGQWHPPIVSTESLVGGAKTLAPNRDATASKRTYVTDSFANALRTLVAGLAALIVNPFVIRSLSDRQYSSWILALSIGAYVPFAETGIGTAIIRFVAPDRTGRSDSTTGFLASALAFATLAGIVVVAIVGGLVWFTSVLFGDAPASIHSDIRMAGALCMISGFFGLWTSVANGYLAARRQTVTSAVVSVGVAGANGLSLVYVSARFHSIFALASTVAIIAFLQSAALLCIMGRRSGVAAVNPLRANRKALRTIWSHCLGTGWWSISMLLIGGLDLFVVARVDFANVGAYGIAARLIGLVISLLVAATSPLITIASRTAAEKDTEAVSLLLIRSTRITNCANVLVGGVLFSAAPAIVRIYAGERYAASGSTLLRILLIGNLVRQMGGSLGLVMVATGEHRKAVIPPIAEGISNLAVSVVLGSVIGAAGVAVGTVVGAVVSLALYSLIVFPRFRAFSIRPKSFFGEGVLPSLAVFSPALVAGLLNRSSSLGPVMLTTTVELCAAAALFARFGLKADERHAAVNYLRSMRATNLKKLSYLRTK
jgi:O-antigen/teichoic acid export membrane protein